MLLMQSLIVIALALSPSMSFASQPTPEGIGRLCVATADESAFECRDIGSSGELGDALADSADEKFVWLPNRGPVEIGRVISGASASLGNGRSASLAIRFVGDPDELPTRPVRFLLEDGSTKWSWEMPAAGAQSLTAIKVPPAAYSLTVTAEGFKLRKVRFEVSPDRQIPADAGEIVIEPIPSVRGNVVDERGEPFAGATISSPQGATSETDRSGSFRLPLEDVWPRYLEIRAPRYGSRFVALPATPDSHKLPPVQLRRSGTVRVRLLTGAPIKSVDLLAKTPDATDQRVQGKSIVDGEEIVFPDVAPGSYRILARGDGPLERYAEKIAVAEGETVLHDLTFPAVPLRVDVRRGDEPVASASVQFANVASDWSVFVTADDMGVIESPLWQPGDYRIRVKAPGAKLPATFSARLVGESSIAWTAKLGERRLFGTVRDKESGRFLPLSEVVLSLDTGTSRSTAVAVVDDAGNYEFMSLEAGSGTLSAVAPGYARSEVTIDVEKDAKERRQDFDLIPATTVNVQLVSADGQPTPGFLIDPLADLRYRSDALGRFPLQLAPNERKSLWALTSNGSFLPVIVHADPTQADHTRLVSMPAPIANLHVRTEGTDGAPVPNVQLVVRFEGAMIPAIVTSALREIAGMKFQTAGDGMVLLQALPKGTYEIWPSRSREQLQYLLTGSDPNPVVLNARPGDNSVVMTLKVTKD